MTTATSRAEEERQPGGEPPHAPERAPERAALRVLVVDDDAVDRMIVRRALARSGVEAVLDEAATVLEALALVGGGGYDCVLLDYNLPGGDGLTLLRGIRQAGLALPVVMLTGQGGEEVAVELMKAGAADYIAKAALTPARLAQSLRHAVDLARAAAAAERAEAERRASAARTARLQEVTALLASAVSTDEVARLFVTQVRDALHAATAWIGLRASDGAALVALASVGFAPGAIAAFDRVPLEAPLPAADVMRDGVLRAFATRAELVAAYPALAAETAAGAQDGVVVLPLDVGREPFGVMTLGFPDARALSSEDRAFVLALARQCAQALERARLYEGERASRAAAERLAAQLAGAALAIARQASLTGVLHEITVQARAIIGAHQAVTSMTTGLAWEQAIHAVARSEQYAACAGDAAVPEVRPTGAGPAHLVAERNAPMRMTQAELEAHRGGQALGAPAGRHPPMGGWLAAPLVASDGANLGLIQLSDKVDGEFTAADESILIQLAQMASAAVENARLRERAELARQEAEEANRAKSEFLARMSHDLRTPLNAIGGYAQLVEMGVHGPVTPPQLEALARIRRAQQHLLTLINDILSFAKLEAGQMHVTLGPVAVRPLLEELATLARPDAESRGLVLASEVGPEGLAVHADRARLMQVLLNLTSNAIKFTEAGTVQVEARLEARVEAGGAGEGAADVDEAGRTVALRVHDTGRGIPPHQLESIFAPFVQARTAADEQAGGVGLGLAISRELVRMMGGALEVDSAEGQGSTFTVRLARAISASDEGAAAARTTRDS